MKTSQRPSSQKKISYGSKKLSPPYPYQAYISWYTHAFIPIHTTRRMRRGVGCRVFVYVCIWVNEYASSLPLAVFYLARYTTHTYIHFEPFVYNSIL
jgi:hypothetical protein